MALLLHNKMEKGFHGVFTMSYMLGDSQKASRGVKQISRQISLFILAGFSCVSWANANAIDIDQSNPKAWIQLMNDQVRQVELDGYFTYERNSHSSSYHYIRQVDDGGDRQRLIFMDGDEQELIFEAGVLRCLHPKNETVHHLRTSEIKSIFNVRKDFTHVWDYYDGALLSDKRIAGRLAKVIKLSPKDSDRFPYIFSVDAQTGVLLKMMVTDGKGKLLERFRYITISYDDVSDAVFTKGVEKFTAVALDVHQGDQYSPSKAKKLAPLNVKVSVPWVPVGFVEKTKSTPVESAASRTFSDGLSSFSLFVELLDNSLGDVDASSPSISTVNGGTAVSARYAQVKNQSYQLTVIGELPLEAVIKISEQIIVE